MSAHADQNDVAVQQRNSDDNGWLTRFLTTPGESVSGIMYLDGPTVLPGYLLIGSGLSIESGELRATSTVGPQGPDGPTGATGAQGSQGETGPQGETGAQGVAGPTGPIGVTGPIGATGQTGSAGATGSAGGFANFSQPFSRTLALATAYQCTDNTKTCIITTTISSAAALSLTAGTTNTADILIGTTSSVATGTGAIIAKYFNSLTGTLVVGLALNTGSYTSYVLHIPVGGYFAIRQTGGAVTLVSSFEQAIS